METKKMTVSALIKQLESIREKKGDILVAVDSMSEHRLMEEGDIMIDNMYYDEETDEWIENTPVIMITTWS